MHTHTQLPLGGSLFAVRHIVQVLMTVSQHSDSSRPY